MGQGFSIIRALARLNALGALLIAGVLLLICDIGTPTFDSFHFSKVTYNGTNPAGMMTAGLWGYCFTPVGGPRACSPSHVGYNMDPYNLTFLSSSLTTLPGIGNRPTGAANLNLINKPLSESLIFFPLATGAVWLALLPALLPIRIVTLLTIGIVFLAIGATAISFVLALATFVQMNARIGLLTADTDTVHPELGKCLWFTITALTLCTGAFLFLLIALPPKKMAPTHPSAYKDMVSNERSGGTDYSRRYSVEKAHRSTAGSGYAQRNGSSGGSRRHAAASTPRRAGSHRSGRSGRSGRLRAELESEEEDDDDVRPPSRQRSSRAGSRRGGSSRRSRVPDSEEDVSDGY